MKQITMCIGVLSLLLMPMLSSAQSSQSLWQEVSASRAETAAGERLNQPLTVRDVRLDMAAVRSFLATAPEEFNPANETLTFALPSPTGGMEEFAIVETHVLPASLAARYPMIKTYLGRSIDHPANTVRLGVGEMGFNALVFSPEGDYYVEPRNKYTTEFYQVYFSKDLPFGGTAPSCGIDPEHIHDYEAQLAMLERSNPRPSSDDGSTRNNSGPNLYVFDLAIAADHFYSNFVTPGTPTTAAVLSRITTITNQINGVYEREVTIRFILNANQDQMIFLDAMSDPYVNNASPELMINESPAIFNSILGINNFDIGHVFTRKSSNVGVLGVGYFQSVCATGLGQNLGDPHKSNGASGTSNPLNNFFFTTVLHEIGHQFDARHTFNFCTGTAREGTSAFEPGSGSTIMSYAGICAAGNNLQNEPDDYFNVGNYQFIFDFSRNGAVCSDIFTTGNNPPTVDAGLTGTFLPISTPFELTATGGDPDGDAITYCWEQQDLGPATAPNSPTGSAPIFRSFEPNNSPTRIFPRLTNLLNNSQSLGEILPTYSRPLNFRATVRDNNPNGGGVSYENVAFNVTASAGPFLVTFPNTNVPLTEGDVFTIEWDPANTDLAPVNCDSVQIFLSANAGQDFDIVLSAGTPNDGEYTTFVPNIVGNLVNRIKIKALNNVFFDISNTNFTINAALNPDVVLYTVPEPKTVCPGTSSTFELLTSGQGGFTGTFNLLATNPPPGVTFTFDPAQPVPGDTVVVTITGDATAQVGNSVVNIAAQATGGGTANDIEQIDLSVLAGNTTSPSLYAASTGDLNQSLTPTFSWAAIPGALSYSLQVATNPNFAPFNLITNQTNLTDTSFALNNGLTPGEVYYWRVAAENECGFGAFSTPAALQTGQCRIFNSNDVPVDIPLFGQPAVATSTLTINSVGITDDLNVVNLTGTHSSISDLEIRLSKAGGPDVLLFSNICTADDEDFDLAFDDEATPGAIDCPPTSGVAYQPVDMLSAFDNASTSGTYTLTISDNVNFDGGQLLSWGLEICTESVPGPVLGTNDTLFVQQSQQGTVNNSILSITDPSVGANNIFLTIMALPDEGILLLNGNPVSIGDIISQGQINNGSLTYSHSGGSAPLDAILFSVANSLDGWLGVVTVPVKITNIVSAAELEARMPKVFPNPARDLLRVELSQQSERARLSLINQQGQVLQQVEATGNHQFNVADYPTGLYLVRIQENEQTWTVRVVVE